MPTKWLTVDGAHALCVKEVGNLDWFTYFSKKTYQYPPFPPFFGRNHVLNRYYFQASCGEISVWHNRVSLSSVDGAGGSQWSTLPHGPVRALFVGADQHLSDGKRGRKKRQLMLGVAQEESNILPRVIPLPVTQLFGLFSSPAF